MNIQLIVVFFFATSVVAFKLNHKVYDPRICRGQEHGKKLSNNLDCGSFFVCDRGVAELFYCSEGLHFDPVRGLCNWPDEVDCLAKDVSNLPTTTEFISTIAIKPTFFTMSSTITSNINSTLPVRNDTFTSWSTVSSSATTTAFVSLNTTTAEAPTSKANSKITESTTATSELSSLEEFETTQKPTEKSTQKTTVGHKSPSIHTSTTQQPTAPPHTPPTKISTTTSPDDDLFTTANTAPIDPMAGYDPSNVRCLHDGLYFLPHPTKCHMYFICENRNLHIHQCGNGIHWDYIREQCDQPSSSRCYFKEAQSTTPFTTSEAGTTFKSTTEEEIVPECSANTKQQFYPHPYDCQKYYICVQGNLLLSKCPHDMEWNSKNRHCTLPDISNCTVKIRN